MTQEEITQALKSNKALQVYNMPELYPFKNYTPEQLENMTYIWINPDDQNWQPGYETEIPQEAYDFQVTTLNNLPIFVY